MKKIIVGVMIGISLFGLVGCGGSDGKSEPEVKKEPVKTIEIPEEEKSKDNTNKRMDIPELIKYFEDGLKKDYGSVCTRITVREQDGYIAAVLTPANGMRKQAVEDKNSWNGAVNNFKELTKVSKEFIELQGFKHGFMLIMVNDENYEEIMVSVVDGEVGIDNISK